MVKQKIVVDTSVIIDHLRQIKDRKTFLKTILADKTIDFYISSDVIQELFAGQSSREKASKNEIQKILKLFKIVDVTAEIATLTGQIMRDTKLEVQFTDAAIAATTIINNAQLLTLNKKDFEKIKNLQFVSI